MPTKELSKRIQLSPFVVNILKMFTGTMVAQLVPYLSYIVLVRMYSPAEFGDFELYLNTAAMLSILASGNYEHSIVIADNEKSALSSVRVATLLSLCFAALLFVIIAIIGSSVNVIFSGSIPAVVIYLLPVSVFLLSFYRIQGYWFNRNNQYGRIAVANAARTSTMSFWQLLYGWLIKGVSGLMTGLIAGQLVHNIIFFVKSRKSLFKYRITRSDLKTTIVRYKRFPLYSLPSAYFNFVSARLPIFMLPLFFDQSIIAFYAIPFKYLFAPLNLLGVSIQNVYFREANLLKDQPDKLGALTFKIFKKLTLLSAPIFCSVVVFGNELFTFMLGWEMSGKFVGVIAPWLMLVLIISPISIIFTVLEKQKEGILCQTVGENAIYCTSFITF